MIAGTAFKTIMVCDDGTHEAERAVDVAISLAKSLDARLIVLGVVPPPSPESQAEGYGLEEASAARKRLEAKLQQKLRPEAESGLNCFAEIFEGEPSTVIMDRAKKDSVDLVVVGRRRISQARHWLEGSTSERLVRKSAVSILVVHDVDG